MENNIIKMYTYVLFMNYRRWFIHDFNKNLDSKVLSTYLYDDYYLDIEYWSFFTHWDFYNLYYWFEYKLYWVDE